MPETSTATPLEQLTAPPIAEVVCGILFDALEEIDPVLTGVYWARRRSEFPSHVLRPALVGEAQIALLTEPRLRTWLISQDGVFVLQIQTDRFYVNWRKRKENYPRFNEREGKPGLLRKTLDEYDAFSTFCTELTGKQPRASHIELAKIDHLVEGVAWSNPDDLYAVMPWLPSFNSLASGAPTQVQVRLTQPRDGGELSVTIAPATRNDGGKATHLINLETRLSNVPLQGRTPREAFASANALLNSVFADLIPPDVRKVRFMKEMPK